MLERIDGDFALDALPGLEQLTYLARAPAAGDSPDTFTAYTLYSAFRRPATRQDLLAAGLAVSDEPIAFQVWQSDLDRAIGYGAEPHVSDVLADASAGTPLATLTESSAVLTGLASTAGLLPGMAAAAAGLPAFTQVRSVDSAWQVTLTAAATAAGVAAVSFGWGWVVERAERHQTRARWDLTCRKAR